MYEVVKGDEAKTNRKRLFPTVSLSQADKMNDDVVQECFKACMETCKEFVEVIDLERDLIKVKPVTIDEDFLNLACLGFEMCAMGESFSDEEALRIYGIEKVDGLQWSSAIFGRAINMLTAEFLGEGSETTLSRWSEMAQRCLLVCVLRKPRNTPSIQRFLQRY